LLNIGRKKKEFFLSRWGGDYATPKKKKDIFLATPPQDIFLWAIIKAE